MSTLEHRAGIAHHIVLRGHHRSHSFFEPNDYQLFLEFLLDAGLKYGMAVHAYALLPIRAHLLVTPSREDSIRSALDESIRRFEAYSNRASTQRQYKWTAWYRGSEIDSPGFLLTCYRYVERTPVIEKLVNQPEQWFWSSARANLDGVVDELVTPHREYLGLGFSAESRRLAYTRFLEDSRGQVRRQGTVRRRVSLPDSAPGSAL